MNKLWIVLFVSLILGIAFLSCESADKPLSVTAPEEISLAKKAPCVTIKDGTLCDSKGNLMVIGYDQWGYNYQAHLFNGWYHNSPRPEVPWTKDTIDQAPSNTWLTMKWSDEWLSNKDCNGDGKLDRGYSCDPINASSSACPGAWCTNHQSGTYVGEDGETYKWNYFVKIVAAPADASKEGGIWYTADGTEIGSVIWGAYAIIQQVYNDQGTGEHGLLYKSPASPGLGAYK